MRARYFGLGLIVGAGGATAYLKARHRVSEESSDLPRHRALKHGMPGVHNLRFFEDFVIAFDTRTKHPEWVLERISTTDKPRIGDRKNVEFKEDDSFEERFRSRLTDYRGSGYDRGHMAPAANHKNDQAAMDSTFLLTNICPQVGQGFNRDYWARFERFLNQLTKSCQDVFIVTGPLYLPHKTAAGYEMRHALIGEPPSFIGVPTHFFKVVLGECGSTEDGENRTALGAFVMPNAAIAPETPLTAFSVPLQQLEALSGLQFFPAFISKTRQAFHDRAALSWQRKGRQQLLEQQTLRLNTLLNPAGLGHTPPDPLTGLAVFSYPADQEDALLPTASQLLPLEQNPAEQSLVSEAATALAEEAASRIERPGSHLMHKDVCTASALPTSEAQFTQQAMATAPEQGAAVENMPGESSSQLLPSSSGVPSEGLVIDRQHPLGAIRRRPIEIAEVQSEDGLIHLCDHATCKLPPPDWYLKKKQAGLLADKELDIPSAARQS